MTNPQDLDEEAPATLVSSGVMSIPETLREATVPSRDGATIPCGPPASDDGIFVGVSDPIAR